MENNIQTKLMSSEEIQSGLNSLKETISKKSKNLIQKNAMPQKLYIQSKLFR